MKQTLAVLVWAGVIISTTAGEFMNLDFEQANTNHLILNALGNTSDLLPGWNLSYNNVPVDLMNFNRLATGSGPIFAIYSREGLGSGYLTNIANIMTGNYVLLAQSLQPTPAFLSQVGDIPPGATGLSLAAFKDNSTFLRTFLNGTEILNGDISAFAGLHDVKLELQMELAHSPNSFEVPSLWLDRIEFVVPEPSSGALVIFGALVLLGRQAARRQVRKSSPMANMANCGSEF